MSESTIQRAILDALLAAGAFAFRAQAGKVKVRGGYMNLCPAGTPDILVIVPPRGMVVGLEVKTLTGELRESQLAWAAKVRALGGVVETVRSPAEAVAAYVAATERGKKI